MNNPNNNYYVISDALSIIGETPIWKIETNELFWIDIYGKKIIRKNLTDGKTSCSIIAECPGCLFLGGGGELAVAAEKNVYLFSNSDGLMLLYPIVPEGERFNDGKVGPDGKLWVGTISPDSKGVLYRVGSDGKYEILLDSMGNSNGLDWNVYKRKFYLNDTYKHVTYAFDYNEEYNLYNRKILRFWGKENPDGMAIDSDGNLFIALFGSGKVVKVNSFDGEIIRQLDFPVPNVTSVLFAHENYDELIVTTAAYNTDLRKYPLAGAVFGVKTSESGFPLNRIKIMEKNVSK